MAEERREVLLEAEARAEAKEVGESIAEAVGGGVKDVLGQAVEVEEGVGEAEATGEVDPVGVGRAGVGVAARGGEGDTEGEAVEDVLGSAPEGEAVRVPRTDTETLAVEEEVGVGRAEAAAEPEALLDPCAVAEARGEGVGVGLADAAVPVMEKVAVGEAVGRRVRVTAPLALTLEVSDALTEVEGQGLEERVMRAGEAVGRGGVGVPEAQEEMLGEREEEGEALGVLLRRGLWETQAEAVEEADALRAALTLRRGEGVEVPRMLVGVEVEDAVIRGEVEELKEGADRVPCGVGVPGRTEKELTSVGMSVTLAECDARGE